MQILQYIALTVILSAMLLSGCSRNPNTFDPQPTMDAIVTEVISSAEPLSANLLGTWQLDGSKTEENLKSYDSLLALYGTGIHEKAELVLNEDGTMHYFFAINKGGEGSYTLDGRTILADVNPYVVDSLTTFPLTIQGLEEDGTTYLVIEDFGESIYWKKADQSTEQATSEESALAAFDALLAGTETPVNSDLWWIPDFQDDGFIYVYTHLDLDGDGVPELLVQVENDPLAYNGVFHYEDGKIFCWNSDAADGSQWESPLSDGSMVSCHYFGGVRSYTIFRYQPDGTKKGIFDMFAREELIPEDSTEPCPYYEIDREEVDQAAFEQKLAELVTDRALEPSVWTTV